MDRLDGAATPFNLGSLDGVVSNFKTFNKPPSPPQAIQPASWFQDKDVNLILFGIAIFLDK